LEKKWRKGLRRASAGSGGWRNCTTDSLKIKSIKKTVEKTPECLRRGKGRKRQLISGFTEDSKSDRIMLTLRNRSKITSRKKAGESQRGVVTRQNPLKLNWCRERKERGTPGVFMNFLGRRAWGVKTVRRKLTFVNGDIKRRKRELQSSKNKNGRAENPAK